MRKASWLMLALGLALGAVGAAAVPRTVASIGLDANGMASMPDGRVYRVLEEDGKPYLFARPATLLIQDTAP